MTPSHLEHKAKAPGSIPCAIVTVSDTRTPQTDGSGQEIRRQLEAAGHQVTAYHILPDEPNRIGPLLRELMAEGAQRAVIVNGGTGVSRRDVTFDLIGEIIQKPLPGFGELFRSLSYAEIGPAAMLSRATAGTVGGRVIFSLPGSSGAVRLAMEKLIVPELGHLIHELDKQA